MLYDLNNVEDVITRSYLYEMHLAINEAKESKRLLKKSGLYSEAYLTENFGNVMGNYLGNMGLGFLQDGDEGFRNAISEYLIDTIFNFLGLKARTTIGEFFLEVIKEFIENVVIMNPTNIGKYFSDDGCKFISRDLIQVLGESGGDILLRVLLKKISDPSYRSELLGEEGEGSSFESDLIANVVNAIQDKAVYAGLAKVFKEMFQTKILKRIEKYVEQAVCESNLSLSDQFARYFGFGDEADEEVDEEDAV